MIKDENKKNNFFEISLVKSMKDNPSDEIAAELLSILAKHKITGSEPSKELENYILDDSSDLSNYTTIDKVFSIVKKIGRPIYEQKYIAMNVFTWRLIFSGLNLNMVYEETAKKFNTSVEATKQSFERKNHDFGERELCRISLDVFVVMDDYRLSNDEKQTAEKFLKESVLVQMLKDETHRKNKYKDKYKDVI